jgi:hypothetical protein
LDFSRVRANEAKAVNYGNTSGQMSEIDSNFIHLCREVSRLESLAGSSRLAAFEEFLRGSLGEEDHISGCCPDRGAYRDSTLQSDSRIDPSTELPENLNPL